MNYHACIHSLADHGADFDKIIEKEFSDPTIIKWTRSLKARASKRTPLNISEGEFVQSLYRPYTKQWLYRSKRLNEYVNKSYITKPVDEASNRMIICQGGGASFSVLITDVNPDVQTMFNGQYFPLYLYDDNPSVLPSHEDLFNKNSSRQLKRRDAVTDIGLTHFQTAYPSEQISKEDLFYYIYGILHSSDYRERYADNLSKELPRIPAVKKATDFWGFSKAGRALADLHLNYETVKPYPLTIESKGTLSAADYRVEKMKFANKGDKTTVIYNHRITLKGIPEAAWDYVVNGKAALDWVIERQAVRTDKASGIVNDANDWAVETMGNPKYPLELFQRVITVSLETQKIVKALPKLDISTNE